MNLEPLAIEGVYRATPRRKAVRAHDWYRVDALAGALPEAWRPQVGSLRTLRRGEATGLHVSAGHRVVTCVTGRIALVIVDVCRGSGTFKRWIPVDLEPIDHPTIVVPPGTAWGCQGFSDVAVLLTLHGTEPPGLELDANDPDLQITWPLQVPSVGISLANALARGDLPE